MLNLIKKKEKQPDLSSLKNIEIKHLENVINSEISPFCSYIQQSQDIENLITFAENLKSNYQYFVVIGIGGSSNGNRALVEISHTKNIFFLENVDPVEFEQVWLQVKPVLKSTAILSISKSGGTIEVMHNFNHLVHQANIEGIDLIQNSFFITEKNNGALHQFALKNNRPVVEVPKAIGGRFSVLTSVGLIVAHLCHLNVSDVLKGAKNAINNKKLNNELCQLFLSSTHKNYPIIYFWFYNSYFRWFGVWLQQLWAESLGKTNTLDGLEAPHTPVPVITIGSCDQHSILQQVIDGPRNKKICFFKFKSKEVGQNDKVHSLFPEIQFMDQHKYSDLLNLQAEATYQSLLHKGHDAYMIEVDDDSITTSEMMGYLFMTFQIVVATLGHELNINPFDQPGVELGKQLTLKMLNEK